MRYAIKQVDAGVPVAEVCRKYGVSQATYYRWLTKYGGLAPSEVRRMLDQSPDDTIHRALTLCPFLSKGAQ